jgi:hypothetical protein
MKWYEFDIENETPAEARDRRLMQCPPLNHGELEVLRQCKTTVWDGYVISKQARDNLYKRGLILRWNGWQIITLEGLAVLHTLGELRV